MRNAEGFVGFNVKMDIVRLEKELRAALSIRRHLIPFFLVFTVILNPPSLHKTFPTSAATCCPLPKGFLAVSGVLIVEDSVTKG